MYLRWYYCFFMICLKCIPAVSFLIWRRSKDSVAPAWVIHIFAFLPTLELFRGFCISYLSQVYLKIFISSSKLLMRFSCFFLGYVFFRISFQASPCVHVHFRFYSIDNVALNCKLIKNLLISHLLVPK